MSSLPQRVFVDTNILAYAHAPNEGKKYKIAVAALNELWEERTGALSTQVLQEFYSVATRKLKPQMSRIEARTLVAKYSTWCSVQTDSQLLVSASVLEEKHNLQWWDALIIQAALRSGASTLLSEDMQHGQRFGELTVRNPFVESN